MAEALVLKSRMEGLDRHINEVSATATQPESALAKASLKDVLDGRVSLTDADPQLDVLRQSYLSARMAADALAVSLGPKHPRLLAAQSTAETARQALADQLTSAKKRLGQAEQDRTNSLKSLQTARADIARQIDATGIDLGRHEELSAEVAAARKAYDSSAEAAAAGREPVFEASVPQPVETAEQSLPLLRIGLGAAAGLALALTLAAWRRQSRAVPSAAETMKLAPHSEPTRRIEPEMVAAKTSVAEAPAKPAVLPPVAETEASGAAKLAAAPLPHEESIVAKLQSIKARSRSHEPANTEPLASGARLGLDHVAPEDLPLIDKLRQVAPHMFADPAEEAEIERLRQELADLRARVLTRKSNAA